jgi:hypothetical protein
MESTFNVFCPTPIMKSIFVQATITQFEPFSFLESLTAMAMGREREATRGGGVGLD